METLRLPTPAEFRSMTRPNRKRILAELHDLRRKRSGDDLTQVLHALQVLEEIHHALPG